MPKTLSSNDLKAPKAKAERKRIRSAGALEKIIPGLGGRASHDQLHASLVDAGGLTPRKLKEFLDVPKQRGRIKKDTLAGLSEADRLWAKQEFLKLGIDLEDV